MSSASTSGADGRNERMCVARTKSTGLMCGKACHGTSIRCLYHWINAVNAQQSNYYRGPMTKHLQQNQECRKCHQLFDFWHPLAARGCHGGYVCKQKPTEHVFCSRCFTEHLLKLQHSGRLLSAPQCLGAAEQSGAPCGFTVFARLTQSMLQNEDFGLASAGSTARRDNDHLRMKQLWPTLEGLFMQQYNEQAAAQTAMRPRWNATKSTSGAKTASATANSDTESDEEVSDKDEVAMVPTVPTAPTIPTAPTAPTAPTVPTVPPQQLHLLLCHMPLTCVSCHVQFKFCDPPRCNGYACPKNIAHIYCARCVFLHLYRRFGVQNSRPVQLPIRCLADSCDFAVPIGLLHSIFLACQHQLAPPAVPEGYVRALWVRLQDAWEPLREPSPAVQSAGSLPLSPFSAESSKQFAACLQLRAAPTAASSASSASATSASSASSASATSSSSSSLPAALSTTALSLAKPVGRKRDCDAARAEARPGEKEQQVSAKRACILATRSSICNVCDKAMQEGSWAPVVHVGKATFCLPCYKHLCAQSATLCSSSLASVSKC